jgi:hypothetical protein
VLILSATTDKIQVITDAARTVDVHATYVDLSTAGAATPGRQNTAISTATTTDIVSAPAASTYRNIKFLTIRNKDASTVTVTVQYNANGTLTELVKMVLTTGEELHFIEGDGWQHFNVSGALVTTGQGGVINLPAGTATQAPLTFTSGTVLTAAAGWSTRIRWYRVL